MRHLFAASVAVALLGLPWLSVTYPEPAHNIWSIIENAGSQLAAVILSHHPKTVVEIQAKYNSPYPQTKVRILIVPGHESDYGGTNFGSVLERDVVVTLANDLADFLRRNSRFEVFVTRDQNNWSPTFAQYFKNYWDDIIAWQKASRQETIQLVQVGKFQKTIPTVQHNRTADGPAYRLYGINKWANENDIDVTIHVHLNDYPRYNASLPGEHSGFAIYVPQDQFYNSTTTQALAATIFKRLAKYNAVSDLPGESEGIIEDQNLIAVGAYNTADAASMLIEYGYIYEPQFVNKNTRDLALKDLAYQTYIGLTDFFDTVSATTLAKYYDTVAVPYDWRSPQLLSQGQEGPDVFALQTALLLDGEYPPSDRDKNDCPRTGRLGPCTQTALNNFQKKYGITGEIGNAGAKTVEQLNKSYGLRGL